MDVSGLKSGAQKRTRTSTTLRSPAPEAGASTNSAIWARGRRRPLGGGRRACQHGFRGARGRTSAKRRKKARAMKDKLVTIFGGGGFVGRYVVQALLRGGARVRVAERDPRHAWFLKPLGGLGQTQFVAADVTLPETVSRAVQGADAVINMVGVLAGDFERLHV